MLLDMARIIKNNRILFNSNIFPHEEMSIRALLAKERILKLIQDWDEKQIKSWSLPELLLQLLNDSQTINESLKQREEKRIESEQAANQAVQEEQEEPVAQSFLLNWNFPMADDDEYTIIYRSSKAITPDLPTEEPDNSLSMGDEHLNTIPETEKSSVENLVPIPSESKGISDDICDVPFCDNDHFDAEFGLINSLLSRDISITSPKIDFLPEEFAGELDLIDPILPGIDEDDFDEEEGEIDIDILQIEDEILREKLLNVNLLIDKIEALNLTPSIPFVLEYPSSSPIPVVDSDFLIEEVDTFLVSEDSIPPGIESDFDSEGDIVFLDNLLNNDPIPEYERFTFDIEPDTAVINNFDELNEDECFDPGGGTDIKEMDKRKDKTGQNRAQDQKEREKRRTTVPSDIFLFTGCFTRVFKSMLLKKLPEKLGDPGKFLIPCNFLGMDKKLSLPELTPTWITLELADRSITYPKGLAEDVFVKVGKFHFPADFVVVDFEADPRVPLILGRSFLRTGHALIDVYGEEITLRVDNEAVTFNLDQTTRYSSINDKSVNRIDIIDAVCEEYALELLGFSNNTSSGGNPTPTSESFTSEFILEEIEAYLKDDSISPEIDHADCDPEGDICLIEKLLNNDPFQLPPIDLKQSEVTKAKSSIEEPPELELKDLPSHLEYAYLEENDKFP
ncbi:reverse transcriptase domain-containing protein [Tanacetum coccineum]